MPTKKEYIKIEDLCIHCFEPLLIIEDVAYCRKCQPNINFMVGSETCSTYSFVQIGRKNRKN